jgi:hypothetical protein
VIFGHGTRKKNSCSIDLFPPLLLISFACNDDHFMIPCSHYYETWRSRKKERGREIINKNWLRFMDMKRRSIIPESIIMAKDEEEKEAAARFRGNEGRDEREIYAHSHRLVFCRETRYTFGLTQNREENTQSVADEPDGRGRQSGVKQENEGYPSLLSAAAIHAVVGNSRFICSSLFTVLSMSE